MERAIKVIPNISMYIQILEDGTICISRDIQDYAASMGFSLENLITEIQKLISVTQKNTLKFEELREQLDEILLKQKQKDYEHTQLYKKCESQPWSKGYRKLANRGGWY